MNIDSSYSPGLGILSWKSDVQAAVNEADLGNLLGRVHAAEIAIFHRLQELASEGNGPHEAEHASLAEGLETLRQLKRDRLGFPDWNQKK